MPLGQGGYLVLKRPWPAMLRGIYGDPERYKQTYWSRFPGMYFAGDGAKRDSEGYFWLLGRVDDVMNVSGHRLSTTEIESALVSHPAVAEAAVVGGPDPVTGEAINAFVILRLGNEPSKALGEELRNHVAHKISPIAKPKSLMFVPDLPKTRSGKIMRRLLKDIATGRSARRHHDPRRRERRERHPREVGRGRRGVGGQRRPRRLAARGCDGMPFNFLRRRKGAADEAGGARWRREAAGSAASVGSRAFRFDGLTEDWRLTRHDAHRGPPVRCAQSARDRSRISDVQWAPIDGSGPMVPAPGLKSIDPYDLIAVLAGPDTLPDVHGRGARRATRAQGALPGRPGGAALPDRRHRARLPRHRSTADARAGGGDVRPADRRRRLRRRSPVADPDVEVVLVNRLYVRGVEETGPDRRADMDDAGSGCHRRLV